MKLASMRLAALAAALLLGSSAALAQLDLTTNAVVTEIANAGTTGTTVNKLAKLTGAPTTAVITTAGDTLTFGIVIGGAGTTGNAQIAVAGQASCVFDGATTAGDFVQVSATVNGDCHDTGAATYPTSDGIVIGRVLSTNGAGGTYAVGLYGTGANAAGAGGSGTVGSGTQWQIGEYTGAGTTTAVNGVTIPSCPDSAGNHLNFNNATGAFTCGTTSSGGGGSSVAAIPQGRLTLTTAKPVMTADAVAQTTIFYDTFQGNQVPVWNGSAMVGLTITADEISMGLSATNHLASTFYDVFAVSNSGSLALCTVKWTNGTTRASAVSLKSGVWTITAAPTNCFGGAAGATDLASMIAGANQATLLGCMATTATNGQTAMQFTPAAASGGTNTWRGLTNVYNTKIRGSTVTDSTASWTVTGSTFAAMHASNSWRVNYIDCLGQLSAQADLSIGVGGGSTQDEQAGVCLNSTSCTPAMIGLSGNQVGFFASIAVDTLSPVLGFNFVQAVDAFVSGGTAPTVQGFGASTARSAMRVTLEY